MEICVAPEFSVLKFLPLAYHKATSWPPPWISHLFKTMVFLGATHFFKAGLFWIRYIHNDACGY